MRKSDYFPVLCLLPPPLLSLFCSGIRDDREYGTDGSMMAYAPYPCIYLFGLAVFVGLEVRDACVSAVAVVTHTLVGRLRLLHVRKGGVATTVLYGGGLERRLTSMQWLYFSSFHFLTPSPAIAHLTTRASVVESGHRSPARACVFACIIREGSARCTYVSGRGRGAGMVT